MALHVLDKDWFDFMNTPPGDNPFGKRKKIASLFGVRRTYRPPGGALEKKELQPPHMQQAGIVSGGFCR